MESTKKVCSNDTDDDSSDGSSYSPLASDDSETDDKLSSDTAASVEKKFIVFEIQPLQLFKLCQYCGSPKNSGKYGENYNKLYEWTYCLLGITTIN